jgi:hypothetical protein
MIVSRVFAVIIAAIAVEYIVEGIKNLFVVWILYLYYYLIISKKNKNTILQRSSVGSILTCFVK